MGGIGQFGPSVTIVNREKAGEKPTMYQLHTNADCSHRYGNETQQLRMVEIPEAHFAPSDNGANQTGETQQKQTATYRNGVFEREVFKQSLVMR